VGVHDACRCFVISWPLVSSAQPLSPAAPKHIGLLHTLRCSVAADDVFNRSFDRRLAELGWTMGTKLDIKRVSTVGRLDQLPALARELVFRTWVLETARG
jgi:hypothetical protein